MTNDDTQGRTFEGRAFPSESEWLELSLSSEEESELIAKDFTERTLLALRDPTPEILATYQPPVPSADFVARTMAALHTDRRKRWRELLARYVAPEPSREFVARTLRALTTEPEQQDAKPSIGHQRTGRPSLRLTLTVPLLAAAAVLMVALSLPNDATPPIELRATESIPVAFGIAHSESPLPALLSILDRDADPYALPNTGGDGVWLLQSRSKR